MRVAGPAGTAPVALEDVKITLPDGRRIVEAKRLSLAAGESVLLVGPSGSGKSTCFRAISGIWPFGEGRIQIPDGARVMVVPQKPYTPIGTLRAAVTYPEPADTYLDDDIRRALEDARLGSLAGQLDREDIWSQRLSGGELQRIAMARALLMQPDWLFLDEATPPSTRDLRPIFIACLPRACRKPRSFRSAIARRCAPSTSGAST